MLVEHSTTSLSPSCHSYRFTATPGKSTHRVKLPADVTCSACVFQWRYRTGKRNANILIITRPAKIQLFSKDIFDSKLCSTSIFSLCFPIGKHKSTLRQTYLKKYIKTGYVQKTNPLRIFLGKMLSNLKN